jgi:hypothetical protein
MKLSKLILLLILTLSVQGCFFIFIPGSWISGASDALTGSEGANCVGANAKVGDKVRLPGGGVGTIKSLSGTSVRCTNPELPIRALLEFPDDKTTPPPPTPYATRLGLTLPAGWEQKALTQPMIIGNGVLYAINRTTDTGVLLSASKREGITDLMEFAITRRANQANRLTDPQQSEVLQTQISGRNAFRFDVTGTLKSGQKITFMVTIIEGATEIASLNTWTTAANFERQKEAMGLLAENITGL